VHEEELERCVREEEPKRSKLGATERRICCSGKLLCEEEAFVPAKKNLEINLL